MEDVILKVENLTFSYDGLKPVLKNLNLTVKSGESLAVMGSSGSGKTTLLKIIAGLLYPYSGKINVNVGKGRIGYIPQQVGLVKNLTALQNVLLGALGRVGSKAVLLGRFPREEVELAKKLLEDLNLLHLAERKASQLSGGERQRIALARSLMQSPSILLADEFVADLDFINATEVMRLTVEICKRNKVALLMTMHDIFLVNKFADRVAILKDGKIAKEMDAGEIDFEKLAVVLRG